MNRPGSGWVAGVMTPTISTSRSTHNIQTTAEFERSLGELAEWLNALTATATAPDRPAATADTDALNTLLAQTAASSAHDDRMGLARGSFERRRFRQVVGPALWESDCLRHAVTKPRGYPGDFQLMQRLYDNHPSGTTPRGRALDAWTLGLPFSQAVRTRGALMARLLLQAWLGGGRRVTNIACGAAPELAVVHRRLPFQSVTLLDQDAAALAAAVLALGAVDATRIQQVCCPVREIISRRHRLDGGRDVIYSMGLYDYLPARTAVALTDRLWASVAPGGLLAIGNFAAGNHADRHLLEAALDWYLVYRTRGELLRLVQGLPDLAEAHVETDPTGCLHMLVARRAR
jgi:extracellular factor (EF) 3-hydroxypalmitic acid methyl ester biosynthesis protein